MSPSLLRLIKIFDLTDSFRSLHPQQQIFSHYYHSAQNGNGATRIDRSYHWGELTVNQAWYEPIAFSDHMAHVVSVIPPVSLCGLLSPHSK